MPAGSLSNTLARYTSVDLNRAVTNKDVKLMESIVAIEGAASPQHPEWEADATRMSFYLQTENEQELIKVLDRFS